MRIVAVADTHAFQADLGAIPDGDVFVHAGDLLRGGTLEELEEALPWIRALPHRHKIVVAGNHDGCFATDLAAARALLGDVVYLEDSGVVFDGVHFWGSPWQPAYNDWWFNLPRGAPLAEKWARIPAGIDVLVTHGPPLGFGDQGPVEGRAGCADLLEHVRRVRPPLHLFGHIHQDGGLFAEGETTFVNVTTWECERMPTVLDYDPVRRIVRGVQVPPARNTVSC
ncbi:MAG: metallophosphatase domain-containing protein [Myxococcales bacterium]|nr:metallophosphatase domain-containing protein [Myxococcales bacterium]